MRMLGVPVCQFIKAESNQARAALASDKYGNLFIRCDRHLFPENGIFVSIDEPSTC